jgi:hypothetical protein
VHSSINDRSGVQTFTVHGFAGRVNRLFAALNDPAPGALIAECVFNPELLNLEPLNPYKWRKKTCTLPAI